MSTSSHRLDACQRFVADTSSIGRARQLVRDHLEAHGYEGEVLDAAMLVASELATNAVLHAGTDFDLRCVVNDAVRIEITDQRPEGEVIPSEAPPMATGGRGLRIVEETAARWGVVRRPDGKTVWGELPTKTDEDLKRTVLDPSGRAERYE